MKSNDIRISNGFTLLELLVAVGVIGLLSAILVPALQKAKGKAYSAVCSSNLKQWSLSYSLYAFDHDGEFTSVEPGNTEETWMTRMKEYSSDICGIKTCPSAKKIDTSSSISIGLLGASDRSWFISSPYDISPTCRKGSFAQNVFAGQPSQNSEHPENFWTGPEQEGCGQTPLLTDARWFIIKPDDNHPLPENGQIQISEISREWVDSAAMKRHGKGVNILFMSGAIVQVEAEELWNMKWHRNYDRKGRINLSNLKDN